MLPTTRRRGRSGRGATGLTILNAYSRRAAKCSFDNSPNKNMKLAPQTGIPTKEATVSLLVLGNKNAYNHRQGATHETTAPTKKSSCITLSPAWERIHDLYHLKQPVRQEQNKRRFIERKQPKGHEDKNKKQKKHITKKTLTLLDAHDLRGLLLLVPQSRLLFDHLVRFVAPSTKKKKEEA